MKEKKNAINYSQSHEDLSTNMMNNNYQYTIMKF